MYLFFHDVFSGICCLYLSTCLSVCLSSIIIIIPPLEKSNIFFLDNFLPYMISQCVLVGVDKWPLNHHISLGHRLNTSFKPSLRVKRVELSQRINVNLEFWQPFWYHERRLPENGIARKESWEKGRIRPYFMISFDPLNSTMSKDFSYTGLFSVRA